MIFAFIPPPGIAGGWLCFFVSLVLIGVLVILVGDLAGIFGCLGRYKVLYNTHETIQCNI